MTSSGVVTTFVHKGFTRDRGIENTPSVVEVRDTKFGTNVSNEKLLNVAKC